MIQRNIVEYARYRRQDMLCEAAGARLRHQLPRQSRNLLREAAGEALIKLGWWLKGESTPQRAS